MLQKCWRAQYLPSWPSQVVLACTAFLVIIDLVCVTEVLACTVLARMAILGCVGVHSISCDHERVCILHKCRRAPRFYYHCVVTLPTKVF